MTLSVGGAAAWIFLLAYPIIEIVALVRRGQWDWRAITHFVVVALWFVFFAWSLAVLLVNAPDSMMWFGVVVAPPALWGAVTTSTAAIRSAKAKRFGRHRHRLGEGEDAMSLPWL